MKGKQQLSKLEVDGTRQLAQVRIHMEKIIGVLRQKIQFYNPHLLIKYD